MKTTKIILPVLLIAGLNLNVIAQKPMPIKKGVQTVQTQKASKQNGKEIPIKQRMTVRPTRQTGTTTTVRPIEKMCKPMDIVKTEEILRDRVGRTLVAKLDKDYGFIEMMGNRQNVDFEEFRVRSVKNTWVYTLNDINSRLTRVKYQNNRYVMTIEFERDGSEIKGVCPGCLGDDDRRAPDINWNDAALQIILKPIAYDNSFTFEIEKVNMLGDFEINSKLKFFLPSLTVFFRNKMQDKFKAQMQETFNSNTVKRMLAEVFRPEVNLLGLNAVKNVDMSRDQIYLCNY